MNYVLSAMMGSEGDRAAMGRMEWEKTLSAEQNRTKWNSNYVGVRVKGKREAKRASAPRS
jgi:hypothetical protein